MCRRENLKLFLKGERCYSDKCSFERRAYAPGQHGQNRFRKVSDYAVQLREKQKVKHMYGMLEGQFRRYFHIADQAKGVTGLNLLTMLERRFDNVVYRLGFAGSRDQARQFIRHNHFQMNGKKWYTFICVWRKNPFGRIFLIENTVQMKNSKPI